MNFETLIGKKYPILEATTNKVVGYKIITGITNVENYAGVVIHLANANSGILIGYEKAIDVISEKDVNPILSVFSWKSYY